MDAADVHPLPDEVERFLAGRLAEPELERLAEHLQSCPECRARLPARLPEDPLVRALRQPLGPEPCSDEPECARAVERLAAEAPSTVAVSPGGETVSFPRLTGEPTPPVDDRLGDSPSRPVFEQFPCPFGRYRILRRLGQGGMGAVYLAEDTLLERRVALKVSHPHGLDREGEERFRREARAAAALQHEGICPVFDHGVHEGVPFITMAYVEGRSLFQVLKEGPPPEPRRAADWVRQAALALAAAHERGVLHRDLKPANVLLDEKGRIKVVDFGLARRAEDVTLTRPGAAAGTPAYMSPEQIQGKPLAPATDVYSLGVILYQLLTGRLPYAGGSVSELGYQIVHTEPPPPSARRAGLDPSLDAVCRRAMAKSPADRYPTMEAFAADLQAYLDGKPVRRPRRLRGWHAALAAAVLLPLAALPFLLKWGAGGEAGADAGTGRQARTTANEGPAGGAGATPKQAAAGARTTREAGKGGMAEPGAAGPLGAWIDVKVWQENNATRWGVGLRDGALPLRAGDEISVHAELTRPAYAYVVWIEADGNVQPIYPWRPGHWDGRPATEKKVRELRLPEEGTWAIKEGPAGMETLLLLAREDSPLPAGVDLRAELAGLGKQPRPGPRSLVYFEDFKAIPAGRVRGPLLFDVSRRDDPVLATQRELGRRLRGLFPCSTAASFANLGR